MGALIADGRGLVPLVGSLRSLEVGVLGDERVVNTGGVRSPLKGKGDMMPNRIRILWKWVCDVRHCVES